MKSLARIGTALALTTGVAACGEPGMQGVQVKTARPVALYERPANIDDRILVLAAGKTATALCFSESATLAVDSIYIEAEQEGEKVEGYAFVKISADTTKDYGQDNDNFNASLAELRELPDCD